MDPTSCLSVASPYAEVVADRTTQRIPRHGDMILFEVPRKLRIGHELPGSPTARKSEAGSDR